MPEDLTIEDLEALVLEWRKRSNEERRDITERHAYRRCAMELEDLVLMSSTIVMMRDDH